MDMIGHNLLTKDAYLGVVGRNILGLGMSDTTELREFDIGIRRFPYQLAQQGLMVTDFYREHIDATALIVPILASAMHRMDCLFVIRFLFHDGDIFRGIKSAAHRTLITARLKVARTGHCGGVMCSILLISNYAKSPTYASMQDFSIKEPHD